MRDSAGTALRKQAIHLVIVGIHFDQSRMFDLMCYAKADPVTNTFPVLGINKDIG